MTTATRTASPFRLEYSVTTRISALPARVWGLLTDVKGWTRWNTTVTSIEGDIALGEKVTLRVPISERTFVVRVAELEPDRRMVWSDGAAPMFKGVRTYTLAPSGEGGTDFSMVEVFQG
ncbi:MAG: SRPBCC domain-containing protein, partial [Gemmatimonadaceae bacterium]|nr:SRPBCC domain-containing protein [Gemmatimonadaceae bacterium]